MSTLTRLGSLTVALLLANSSIAQSKKAALSSEPLVLLDSVVTEQWPDMLPAVNIPAEPTVLNPGQCVRIGVAATGQGVEHFLDGIAISTSITAGAGHVELPLQPAAASKLIRPEGSDEVDGVLAAAGLKNPIPVGGVLAVSSSKWCISSDAADGNATFSVGVDLYGKHITLHSKSIPIESIDSASASSFSDKQALGTWIQTYDLHPEPARLTAALRSLTEATEDDPNALQFFVSAFSHDAQTTRQLGPSIAKLPKHAELLALAIAAKAHVTLYQPPSLSPEEQNLVASLVDLPDAYDMSSGQIWKNLDLLWSQFLATGTRRPIAAIVQTLRWDSDYDAFLQMKAQGKVPSELTPSLIHGLTFGAAQWSLSSFQRNDTVAADYIRALREDPDTPQPIRQALAHLNAPPPSAAAPGH